MIVLDNDEDGAKLLLDKYEIDFGEDGNQALKICRKIFNKKSRSEQSKLKIKYSDGSGHTIAF